MQAIMESIFDIVYLAVVITLGIIILRGAKDRKQFVIFAFMTIVLGCGDAFHLVPRIWALNTTGTENFVAPLGFGTLITSITMTIFYVLLYHFWRLHYSIKGNNGLTVIVYGLSVTRIVLCLFPQNRWFSAEQPLLWGIYRNIPFAILGIITIICFFVMSKKHKDNFRFMWLAIVISFAFYTPVVLWSNTISAIGMLMLPKTCAYIWMVWMGYKAMKND